MTTCAYGGLQGPPAPPDANRNLWYTRASATDITYWVSVTNVTASPLTSQAAGDGGGAPIE